MINQLQTPPSEYYSAPPVNTAYDERRQLWRLGSWLGLAVVGFYFFQEIAVRILRALNLVELYKSSLIAQECIGMFMSVFCVFTPFFLVSLALKDKSTELIPLGKVKPSLISPLLFIGMAIFILSNIATGTLVQIMGGFHIILEAPESENIPGLAGILLSTVSTAVIPALTEEFAMRGVVLQSLRRFGDTFAIFVSAVIFALMHGNFVQAPFAFIGGLFLGFAAVKAGSLWPCILIHFSNNLMAVLLSYAQDVMPSATLSVLMYGVYAVTVLLGLAFAFFTLRKEEDFFKIDDVKTQSTYREKLVPVLCAPPILFSYILIAINSAHYLRIG